MEKDRLIKYCTFINYISINVIVNIERGKIMKKLILILFLGAIMTLSANDFLVPELEPLRPYLNKTWKGEFVGSEKPTFDVQKWRSILNGTHIRIMHSLNDGEYGGETLIYWDKANETLAYYYFTTAGFFTHGTMKMEDEKFVSMEKVEGDANGITEVKNETEILEDGRLHSKAYFFKNDEWIDGHEIIYQEDSKTELIYK